jgi:hypothetical protein
LRVGRRETFGVPLRSRDSLQPRAVKTHRPHGRPEVNAAPRGEKATRKATTLKMTVNRKTERNAAFDDL